MNINQGAETRQQPIKSFQLGQTVATRGAAELMRELEITPFSLLVRHACCDWGDLSDDDERANNDALAEGNRILSNYTVKDARFWVITEADRSATTILLPEEY